jgi:hypothetical protein
MKQILTVVFACAFAAACSSNNDTTDGGPDAAPDTSGDTGTGDTGAKDTGVQNPPPPTLGMQLDRMGRAAINTVGSKTFDKNNRDAAENAYNHDSTPSMWKANHAKDIAASLAILDALDAPDPNGCGNQVAVGLSNNMMKQAAGAYDFLAGVLADDRLRLFTGGDGKCGLYLAVEANALGVTNQNCGGRTPIDDVVDESYSLLSGAFDFTKQNPFLFGDGVPVDPALSTSFAAGFPFFAPKH